jgi:hypothetical protein
MGQNSNDKQIHEAICSQKQDIFLWLNYLLAASLVNRVDEMCNVFDQALLLFDPAHPSDVDKLWLEYILYVKKHHSDPTAFISIVDKYITRYTPKMMYSNHLQWPLLGKISQNNPILLSLLRRVLMRDYTSCNILLKPVLQEIRDPSLMAEVISNLLRVLPGNYFLFKTLVDVEKQAKNWQTIALLLKKCVKQFGFVSSWKK